HHPSPLRDLSIVVCSARVPIGGKAHERNCSGLLHPAELVELRMFCLLFRREVVGARQSCILRSKPVNPDVASVECSRLAPESRGRRMSAEGVSCFHARRASLLRLNRFLSVCEVCRQESCRSQDEQLVVLHEADRVRMWRSLAREGQKQKGYNQPKSNLIRFANQP